MELFIELAFAALSGYLLFFESKGILLIIRLILALMLVLSLIGLGKTIPRLNSLSKRPFITEVTRTISIPGAEFRVPLLAQDLEVWFYVHGCTRYLRGKVACEVEGAQGLEYVYIEDIKSSGKSGQGRYWGITNCDNSKATEQKYLRVTVEMDMRKPKDRSDYELEVVVGLQPRVPLPQPLSAEAALKKVTRE